MLNFSKFFEIRDNVIVLFVLIYVLGGVVVNNIVLNFVSGGFLYNDYQYFGYGGMIFRLVLYLELMGIVVCGYWVFILQVFDFIFGFVEDNFDGNVI